MRSGFRDFLLGRLTHPLNAYPETDMRYLLPEELKVLQDAGDDGGPGGFDDVRYVLEDRRPWHSHVGLCNSCEHRRAYAEKDRVSAPRMECKELNTTKGVCYCWVLRMDAKPEEAEG